MDRLEKLLEPLEGVLITISRNTVEGWYELEIGVPAKWAIVGNPMVNCEIVGESEEGKLIVVSPTKQDIGLDTLVDFVKMLIKTNKKIAEKEALFAAKMANIKKDLQEEASQFYRELDEMRENSFKADDTKKPKPVKPKPEV
jgi:nitrate reductase NapAB chaperone NapD